MTCSMLSSDLKGYKTGRYLVGLRNSAVRSFQYDSGVRKLFMKNSNQKINST